MRVEERDNVVDRRLIPWWTMEGWILGYAMAYWDHPVCPPMPGGRRPLPQHKTGEGRRECRER